MQQFGCQTSGLASLVFLFVPQDGIETALALIQRGPLPDLC
jgi:hypothetical protein